jgi:N-acetylneuraminic acid mutarotase/Tol biopolymer transport system component
MGAMCHRMPLRPIVGLLLAFLATPTSAAPQAVWAPVADLPEARSWEFAAAIDGRIYVLASGEDNHPGGDLYRYDRDAATWTRLPGAPSGRRAFGGAAAAGKLYVWGGLVRNASGIETASDTVEVFDTSAGVWSGTRGRMPEPRLFAKGVEVNGRLYAVGGIVPRPDHAVGASDEGTISTAVHEYDPIADRWRECPPLPTGRKVFRVAAAGGRLYVLGGWARDNPTTELLVEQYDPASHSWTSKANMPGADYDFAVTTVGEEIYLLSGAGSSDVRVYDPRADRWSSAPPLPNRVRGRLAVTLDGKVYAIGGAARYVDIGVTRAVYRLDPVGARATGGPGDSRPERWVRRRDMPLARDAHSAVAVGGKIYILGGRALRDGKAQETRAVDVYDPATDAWSGRTSMPSFSFLQAVAIGDAILAFGKKDAYKYTPAADTWTPIAPIPTARDGYAVATTANGRVLVIGGMIANPAHRDGWHDSTVVEEYDPATNTWRSRAPLLTAGHAFAAVTVADRVYVMGGDSEPVFRGVEVYDPAVDRWQRAAAMPISNGYFAAFATSGRILALPGSVSHVWAAQEYDPVSDTWRLPTTPAHSDRQKYAAAMVRGTIYTFGGSRRVAGQPDQFLSTVEALITQTSPPSTSERVEFAPGTVSTPQQGCLTFSPDGSAVYFARHTPAPSRLMASYSRDGAWTTPQLLPFSGPGSGRVYDGDPAMSPDGQRLFFSSKEAPDGPTKIWAADRRGNGWAAPAPVADGLCGPSVAADGTLYFCGRNDSLGGTDIYRSRLVDGKYAAPENLGGAVNSAQDEVDAYIAPDQSYLIFVSSRPGGPASHNFYISHQQQGKWSPARLLAPQLLTTGGVCPVVSPDGKRFFYTAIGAQPGIFHLPIGALELPVGTGR